MVVDIEDEAAVVSDGDEVEGIGGEDVVEIKTTIGYSVILVFTSNCHNLRTVRHVQTTFKDFIYFQNLRNRNGGGCYYKSYVPISAPEFKRN